MLIDEIGGQQAIIVAAVVGCVPFFTQGTGRIPIQASGRHAQVLPPCRGEETLHKGTNTIGVIWDKRSALGG